MTDIKEIIQGLHSLKTYLASKAIEEHGPARESLIGMQKVVDSAVNLLKEQEPKTVKKMLIVGEHLMGKCPRCSKILTVQDHPVACGFCGQAVKWE